MPPEHPGTISIGIVGLGSIGARHLQNFSQLGVGRLYAHDPDASKRDKAESTRLTEWKTSLEELLAESPDAIVICTPSNLHVDPALAALEAGCDLLIEKPIAITLEDADRIVEAAEAAGQKVLVGCNLRFHPGVAQLKKALDDGLIGKPLLARAEFGQYLPDWRPGIDYRNTYSARSADGGGIILETVHELDYLTWLGGPAAKIAGYNTRVSDLEIDSEDSAAIAMRLASGMIAELHVDYLRPAKRRGCEIIGTTGAITWLSEGEPPEKLTVTHYSREPRASHNLLQVDAYDHNEQYVAEARHFLDVIAGYEPPALDAADARDDLALALEIRTATKGQLDGD